MTAAMNMEGTRHESFRMADGRRLTVGDEVTISGERASRFRVKAIVELPGGTDYVDVYGGTGYRGTGKGYMALRTFDMNRVATIHRKAEIKVYPPMALVSSPAPRKRGQR